MHRNQNLEAKRVAIYARFSSERQRETSIDDQVRRCRDHVAQAGGDPGRATVFSDYAISGSSLARPGFEALMAAVDAKQVDAIVTEDISRISRDFADSALVFKRLRYAQVPLISIADGIDTSTRDAKLAFTLKSLVAEIYLDDLRDKTLRGLEGRARAGYSTGSMPYGYRSDPERDSSGRVLGHRIEIDQEQAALVRRIFTMYRDGRSLSDIAKTLNAEGIPSPRAGTRHKHSGWGPSTIRSMLYNERYRGIWKFKEKQWVKVPGTNKRRPRARDEHEVLRCERPHLRIIDVGLWDEVQARLGAIRSKYTKGRNARGRNGAGPARKSAYLLSSLLHCGACGAPMTIVGGSSAAYYRCSNQRKRGTCENKLSVREDVVRRHVIAHLRTMLKQRRLVHYMREQVARKLVALGHEFQAELDQRRNLLARIEARIHGLLEYIADGERTQYVVSSLRELEAKAKAEKRVIAHLEAQARGSGPLPSVDDIMREAFDVETRLQEDVVTGREQLRCLFAGEGIRLVPKGGVYLARSSLLMLELA